MRRIVRITESELMRIAGKAARRIIGENYADRNDVTREKQPTMAALNRLLKENPCGLSDEELLDNMRFIDAYRDMVPPECMRFIRDYEEEADNRRLVW